MDRRRAEVGRDLWVQPLLKQGHPEQGAQDHDQKRRHWLNVLGLLRDTNGIRWA